MKGKKEVEVVDMILKIRCKLEKCDAEDVPVTAEIRNQLKLRMDDIVCMLPDDLKIVLGSS